MGTMRGMMGAGLMLVGMTAWAADANRIVGDWKTPGGSVVRADWCDTTICLTVVKISPTAKGTTDAMNPDPALKNRSVCGIKIGEGFRADSGDAASGGHIYDPESGKTYSAKMERNGEKLKLRGFLGISMFGRTEVWTHVEPVEGCH